MEKYEIESYIKAGKIAREVREFAKDLVKPGMLLFDIAVEIDKKIDEFGAEPAFPVNLSIDEVAAHFTPASWDKDVARGLLKIDLGVSVDGYIADTAFSIDLTEDKIHGEMISLNEKILKNIGEIIEPGVQVRKVGDAAQDTLEKWNEKNGTEFRIIKGLSGHQLDRDVIHAGLTISNYRNESRTKLENVAVAIEPFVTSGAGDIYEGKPGGIFVIKSSSGGVVRDRDARSVLEFIKENYKTRPFCLRWLEKERFSKLRFVISLLVRQGIVYEYPMLVEKSKSPVSQAENTFLILSEGVKISTM